MQLGIYDAMTGHIEARHGNGGQRSHPTRILALSSGGGHWVQLLRMRPAWEGCEVAYATTSAHYAEDLAPMECVARQHYFRFFTFPDATRWNKVRLIWQMLAIARIIAFVRPDVIVSTGASAGYFALRIGKAFGARTIWVDSIANAEDLSLAGQKVAPYADLWLTQWPHLANSPARPHLNHLGAVL